MLKDESIGNSETAGTYLRRALNNEQPSNGHQVSSVSYRPMHFPCQLSARDEPA